MYFPFFSYIFYNKVYHTYFSFIELSALYSILKIKAIIYKACFGFEKNKKYLIGSTHHIGKHHRSILNFN